MGITVQVKKLLDKELQRAFDIIKHCYKPRLDYVVLEKEVIFTPKI